ncbi:MAG: hypothetical protein L6R41_005487 [Letrouitia leprolyta]|nr:MAG: hypothetical protein L6R41_005487 [Letrouitia leprolyta]
MPKDRTLNPAAAQLKADKARALKKSKAAVSAQRNERLAQRNPSRLERQISDLKAGGDLNARDKKQLEDLERQLAAVKKAREKVGDKAPTFGSGGERGGRGGRGGGRGGGVLGKRYRGEDDGYMGRRGRDDDTSGSETDESVRNIPMPRDTPPPIPSSSHRRGPRRDSTASTHRHGNGDGNANLTPLGEGRERHHSHPLPQKPEPVVAAAATAAKTTYEAKPVVRDLRKEAVKAFMPAVVARKVQAVKGAGGRLLEEEEVEKLEREGYGSGISSGGGGTGREIIVDAAPMIEGRARQGEEEQRRLLQEEEERFSREVRMEEISDEDL